MNRRGFVLVALLSGQLLIAASSRANDAALVARINGAPTVTRAGKGEVLRVGESLGVGEIVETNDASKVKLLLADDSVLDVGPNSRVIIQEFLLQPQHRQARLEVLVGRFKLIVSKYLTGDSDFGVRTPTAVAGVRGTVLWGDTERDAICALDGRIEVTAIGASAPPAQVSAGECVNQMKAGKTASLKPTAAELAAYLKEVTLD